MFAFALSSFPAQRNSKNHVCLSPRNSLTTAKRFHGPSLRPTPPACIVHSHPQFQVLKCYSEAPEHEQDDDEDEEQAEVILTDPETNRTLAAEVEHTLTSNDDTYILCFPVDEPVTFATASAEDVLDPVTDQDLLQKMLPNAHAVLAEEHIVLKNSAFFLTVDDQSEDLAEGDEDDDDSEDDRDHADNQPDEDDVEVIAEFLYDGRQHFVVRPVDAIMLVAQVLDDGYRVLRGEELKRVSPIVEEFIESNEFSTP